MFESLDISLVNWSRAQFALTAMYHWLFVPLTLGLSYLIAIMETRYFRTRDPHWKKITKFWMTLFGVNFAIGVATGLVLEFEFGTNWSNYSWFVGDIFGAPLAIEGIMAFFLESTFIAVMFFGWEKVSPRFHLLSTWLVAAGASLSALWILVANGWMQYPVGMHFNPDTARNEMVDFQAVLFSPMAIAKFTHTVTSGLLLASLFVTGVCGWFLLKKREISLVKSSLSIAVIFGLVAAIAVIFTGDYSARTVAKHQPMKFAAMEGLHEGGENLGLTIIGVPSQSEPTRWKIQIPGVLSWLSGGNVNAFVPGIKDLVDGNEAQGIISTDEKMIRGKIARKALSSYTNYKKDSVQTLARAYKLKFEDDFFLDGYMAYFGYGFLRYPEEIIPPVSLTFFSFRIMVGLGFFFPLLFLILLWYIHKNQEAFEKQKWLHRIMLATIPLAYLSGECGWIVAEAGRQPWVIQDYMPTMAAVSRIDTASVQLTFWLFVLVFTTLLIAEIAIMTRQIKKGSENHSNHT